MTNWQAWSSVCVGGCLEGVRGKDTKALQVHGIHKGAASLSLLMLHLEIFWPGVFNTMTRLAKPQSLFTELNGTTNKITSFGKALSLFWFSVKS